MSQTKTVSEPTVYCRSCGAQRSCYRHRGSEYPPDAARAWLRRKGCCEAQDLGYACPVYFGGMKGASLPDGGPT